MKKELVIYQAKDGSIELKLDTRKETVWATQNDMANFYEKDQSVISRHIHNIFKDNEVDKKSNMQKMHIANSDKPVTFYSLDIILAVGYRTNSSKAIKFRIWATKTLKQHITQGYTLNPKVLEFNKKIFLKALEDLKILTQNNTAVGTQDVLSLIQSFSNTFFALESYDKNNFPKTKNQQEVRVTAEEFEQNLLQLKKELIKKEEATQLFAQEKKKGSLKGIFGTVFQSVFGQDAYPTIDEKAAHLLYFIVKNHPFNDGNKRSGAFAFIWLLQKANYDFKKKITPETLTTITLLIAISSPKEKDKMIGLISLLLNNNNKSI